MLMQILSRTPPWVWALAATLLALGVWQRRTRRVAAGALLGLPLGMLALGLWTLAPSFVHLPATAVLWLLALGGGLVLGRRLPLPRGVAWDPAARRLHLPGSWLPLLLIAAIFSLRYAAAVTLALNPALRLSLACQGPLALLLGLLGGLFLGRALGLLSLTRAAQPTIQRHAVAPAL